MTTLNVAQYVLWVLCPLQQILIGAAMVRKRQLGSFPIFFTYIVFHVLQFVAAFISFRMSRSAYFNVYWVSELIDAVLTLAVIEEVFKTVFLPYEALRELGTMAFRWLTIVLCVFVLLSAAAAPGTDGDRLTAGLLVLQRSIQLLQGGLLFFLFLFCRLFGITWRHYVFGISAGFGVIASLMTVAASLRAHLGPIADPWYDLTQAVAFNLGMFVWLVFFSSSKSLSFIAELPSTAQVSTWNRALMELQSR